jgi:hypothetical protein
VIEKEDLPYLTPSQKRFCRLYVRYEEDHIKACKEVYTEMQNPTSYATDLLRKEKIQHFIEYLRQDAYENVLDEDGKQSLTITARATEYKEMIVEARAAGRYTAAASLKNSLDALVGRKKYYGYNLSRLETIKEKTQALQDSLSTSELDIEDYSSMLKNLDSNALSQALENNQKMIQELNSRRMNAKPLELALNFNSPENKEDDDGKVNSGAEKETA